MADIVKKLTIRTTVEGADQTKSDLKGVQSAYEGVAKSAEHTATVTEKVSRSGLSTAEAYRRQTLRLDEVARAQDQMSRATKVANAALDQGVITQGEHAQRLDLIRTRYDQQVAAVARATAHVDKYANSSGLARHELINFSRQIQDVGVSLASGQSPFTVLVQQGAQVADIFASSQGSVRGFFGQVTAGLNSVITPFRAVTAGVVTGVATIVGLAHAYAETRREVERALMGIGRASGVTAGDIERFANTSKSSYGLTVSESRTAAVEFAKTGRIYGENVELAADSVANFSRVTGMETAAATKFLAQAYTQGAEGVDKLIGVLGHLDGRQREHIANLHATGRAQEAQRLAIQGVLDATRQAEQSLGPLDKALIRTTHLWDAMWEAAKRGASVATGGNAPAGEDRAALIRDQLAQARQAPVDARFSSAVSKEEIRRLSDELKLLENAAQNAAKAAADARFKQMATDADASIRAITAEIDQLRELEAQLHKLAAAQSNPEVSGRMGQVAELDAAIDKTRIQIGLIQEAKERTERQNQETLKLVRNYGGVTIETAKALAAGDRQLSVAQAVGATARIAAQEQATYSALVERGVAPQEAQMRAVQQSGIAYAELAVASQQQLEALQDQHAVASAVTGLERMRAEAAAAGAAATRAGLDGAAIAAQTLANAYAAVNSNAKATLLSLQDQFAVSAAYTEQEKISAQYVADRNQLLRDGVNPALAEAVAQAKAANAEAALRVREAKQAEEEQRKINEATARNVVLMRQNEIAAMNYFEELHRIWIIMQDISHFTLGGNPRFGTEFADSSGKPNQYVSSNTTGLLLGSMYPAPGATVTQTDWGRVAENRVNQILGGGGSVASAITQTLGQIANLTSPVGQANAQMLTRLNSLLSETEKQTVLQQEIAHLSQLPASVERNDLISQLNQSLEQLSQSTDNLNNTMQSVLSPYYTEDPRKSHLGFRAGFADGGSFIVPGGYSANDNMMASFPVASGEEVIVNRTPGQRGGDDNRVVNIDARVIIQGNADQRTVDQLKQTNFQRSQTLKRMALG